jgi:hypothetical protein
VLGSWEITRSAGGPASPRAAIRIFHPSFAAGRSFPVAKRRRAVPLPSSAPHWCGAALSARRQKFPSGSVVSQLISRFEARSQGLKFYFTDKSCPHGHIDYRRVDNGGCRECQRICHMVSDASPQRRARKRAWTASPAGNSWNKAYETSPQRRDQKKAWDASPKRRAQQKKARVTASLQRRIGNALRTRLYTALKKQSKRGSAVRDLGCTIADFVKYIERQFQPGMFWENHGAPKEEGGWHLDHIKPLASFDLTDRKQLLEAVYFTNLQPLWQRENLRKHAREMMW